MVILEEYFGLDKMSCGEVLVMDLFGKKWAISNSKDGR
jgi:hypothetical protein